MARYRPNGVIEYVGRTDYQVKIRGLRIEIGEIEAVLDEYPDVEQSVVVVHELVNSDKRLTAFLTVKDKRMLEIEKIRKYLLKRLPEYMVPAYFMILKEMPLNSNGKINRRELPTITEVMNTVHSAEKYVAPRNRTEVYLTKLWEELLGVECIGIHDDFFELGGHSLLVARMAADVQEQWDVELKLPMIFQNRTIEKLAIAIEEGSFIDDTEEMNADELWNYV